MRIFAGILGLILLSTTLWDAFETIILPRRVTRPYRLVRLFYRVAWGTWSGISNRIHSKKLRDNHLSYFGPLSLLMLFATWASALIFSFSILHWAAGSAILTGGAPATFRTDLYMSGSTFFTLGLGDVLPRTTLARVITVSEAGVGFGFLAIVISCCLRSMERFATRIEYLAARCARRIAAHRRGVAPAQHTRRGCRPPDTVSTRLGDLGRAVDGESPLVSNPGLLSLAARQSILDRGVHNSARRQCADRRLRYRRGKVAGAAHVRDFAPRSCGFSGSAQG